LEEKPLYMKSKELIIKEPEINRELQVNWLASADYLDGVVKLELSQKLKPYFLRLKEFFTKCRLYFYFKIDDIVTRNI